MPEVSVQVTVRPAQPEDAEAAEELGRRVAAQPLLVRYGVSATGLSAELARLVRAQPPLGAGEAPGATRVLLGLVDEELRGFARFTRSGSLGGGGYLQLIAIQPGAEGGGLGARLLQGVEEAVRERSHSLFLLTADFNHAAQRFYERHGYQRAGALPGYARPDIVELLYWKRL